MTTDVRAVALAAGAAVAWSVAYYTALGPKLAQYSHAYAGDARPPAWVMPVELARSATVATAVSVLADRAGVRGPAATARMGLGLWAAFPAVLLTGSVVHEKVPWQLATIHSGDWLAKLFLVSALIGRRKGAAAMTAKGAVQGAGA